MQNIPNFRNWLENLAVDSESWAPNQIHVVEHLLKQRKENLSLQITRNLQFTLDMERRDQLVKCGCNERFCCNRKTYLSVIAFNTRLGYRQLELRDIKKTNVTTGIQLQDFQKIPACKIVRPIFWQHRVDAAKTIQKYWRRAISNPNYVVCRNRLIHEYSGMM